MTSNAPDYAYQSLLTNYQQTLNRFVGPTDVLVSGETLQLKDYSKTDWEWSIFDPVSKNKDMKPYSRQNVEKPMSSGWNWHETI